MKNTYYRVMHDSITSSIKQKKSENIKEIVRS